MNLQYETETVSLL